MNSSFIILYSLSVIIDHYNIIWFILILVVEYDNNIFDHENHFIKREIHSKYYTLY